MDNDEAPFKSSLLSPAVDDGRSVLAEDDEPITPV